MSNLSNMQRIIFREDPGGIIPEYMQRIQAGKSKISDPLPERVANFLKTTTPADFNNCVSLQWRYIILKGVAWKIDDAPDGYTTQNQNEAAVLQLLKPEHPGA